MVNYVKNKKPKNVFLVTECSMSDNIQIENPDVNFIKPCNICPHMKSISLSNILDCLQNKKNEILIDSNIIERARGSIEKMIDPIVDEDTDWDEVIVKFDSIPDDNIKFTSKQLKRFTTFIKTNCLDWKKKYELGGIVHDGTMWEVNIQIDDVKLKSEGRILFPDNFKEFTYELSLLTGGKMFDNE